MLKYTIGYIKRGDCVLLLNRNAPAWMGAWNDIGGKLEPGETPEEGILREIREETGIELPTARYKGTVTWEVDGSRRGGMHVFLAELPADYDYATPRGTEEGILDWKPVSWVLHPDNVGVAANLPKYLPVLLADERLYDHRCVFREGRLVRFVSVRIGEPEDASSVGKTADAHGLA